VTWIFISAAITLVIAISSATSQSKLTRKTVHRLIRWKMLIERKCGIADREQA
jgi:hypothetical protein